MLNEINFVPVGRSTALLTFFVRKIAGRGAHEPGAETAQPVPDFDISFAKASNAQSS